MHWFYNVRPHYEIKLRGKFGNVDDSVYCNSNDDNEFKPGIFYFSIIVVMYAKLIAKPVNQLINMAECTYNTFMKIKKI